MIGSYGFRCGAMRNDGLVCLNRVPARGVLCRHHGGTCREAAPRVVCAARHVTGTPCNTTALPGRSVCHLHVRAMLADEAAE